MIAENNLECPVEPVGPWLYIRVNKDELQKVGAIYLPKKSASEQSEANMVGTVIAMGPLAYKNLRIDPTNTRWVEIGDRVIFQRYGGQGKLSFEKFDIRILSDDSILAKYTDKCTTENFDGIL